MRNVLVALTAFHGINGLVMLFLPEFWYATIPDVEHTGPFNVHFVRDIGLGFIASAAALALVARSPSSRIVIWPAAIFLGGHAGLHLFEMAVHGISPIAAARDGLLIVLPGLLPLVLVFGRPIEQERRA